VLRLSIFKLCSCACCSTRQARTACVSFASITWRTVTWRSISQRSTPLGGWASRRRAGPWAGRSGSEILANGPAASASPKSRAAAPAAPAAEMLTVGTDCFTRQPPLTRIIALVMRGLLIANLHWETGQLTSTDQWRHWGLQPTRWKVQLLKRGCPMTNKGPWRQEKLLSQTLLLLSLNATANTGHGKNVLVKRRRWWKVNNELPNNRQQLRTGTGVYHVVTWSTAATAMRGCTVWFDDYLLLGTNRISFSLFYYSDLLRHTWPSDVSHWLQPHFRQGQGQWLIKSTRQLLYHFYFSRTPCWDWGWWMSSGISTVIQHRPK
jgi:hypothetical protein